MRHALVPILLAVAATAQAQTATLATDQGAVEVPADPQRVVATYSTDVDHALVLGLPLVGGGTVRGEAGYPFAEHQAGYDLGGVAPVSIFPQLNFEAVAALDPDLIIANYTAEENGYDLLSAIAPTAWIDQQGAGGWRGLLRRYAEAFGRTERAEAFIGGYDGRLAEVRARMPAGETTLALANNLGDGTFILMQASDLHVLYEELGFVPSAHVPATYEERQAFSEERIDLLADADVILLWRNRLPDGGLAPSSFEAMAAVPGWEELPAVQAGQVHEMPVELFYTSPLTDLALIDLVDAEVLP